MTLRRLALAAAGLALLGGPLLGASAALAQMPAPHVITDPHGAPAGVYKLDPAHASATVKLAHMGLSHYTMRFDTVSAVVDDPDAEERRVWDARR